MAGLTKEQAAALALQRGLRTPAQIRSMGLGHVADMAETGQLAPGGAVARDTTQDREYLDKMRTATDQARYTADEARGFMDLNTRSQDGKRGKDWDGTGGMLGVGLPWGGGSIGDVAASFNAPLAEMKAITAKVAPKNRVVGSGSSSDKDVDFMVRAFPNIQTPGPANQRIAEDLDREARDREDKTAFFEDYFSQYGTLLGASEAWSMRNRTASSAVKSRGDVERASAPDVPQAGLASYRKRFGAGQIDQKAPRGSAANPFLARTMEQAERLPQGSHVILPDGSFGVVD